ncbi:MAG: hypothetical protein JWP87_3804 [Labilithrix sp.]|nr:hypothetical protein [Labilithrix sp.]
MRHDLFTAALVSSVFLAFAPSSQAQVETSAMTDESRPVGPKPEPSSVGPRAKPTMFGVGVASTLAGAVAMPVGGLLVLTSIFSNVDNSLNCAGPCHSSSDTTGTIGAVVMVSGVILLAAGIPMIVLGGKRLPKETAYEPLTFRF